MINWKKLTSTFFRVLLIAISFTFILLPIVWTILTAFKTRTEIFTFPPVWIFKPHLENFVEAYTERPIGAGFINSIIVAVSVTIISLGLGCSAGYALARFKFKRKAIVSSLILVSRTIPTVILTLPFFIMMQHLGLRDTHISLIISHCSFAVPLSIWLCSGFMEQTPVQLEEAAQVDGCTRYQAISKIILPLVAPGMAATGILLFLESWNDLTFALILTNRVARTLPVEIISFITPVGVNWGPMFATSVLIMIPSIIFIFFASRKLTYGLSQGALKG